VIGFSLAIVMVNSATLVRGPKHVEARQDHGVDGRVARELLDGIDTTTRVGLRDRTLDSVMTFAFARIRRGRRYPHRGLFTRKQMLVSASA
jgi:hypothetical protein